MNDVRTDLSRMYLLAKNFYLSEPEKILIKISMLTGGSPVDLKKIKEFVNEYPNLVFYFDIKLEKRGENSNDAYSLWIDSGYSTPEGEPIFISLYKQGEIYAGFFTGTSKYLVVGINQKYPKNEVAVNKNYRKFLYSYADKVKFLEVQRLNGSINARPESDMQKSMDNACPFNEAMAEPEDAMPPIGQTEDKSLQIAEEIKKRLIVDPWESIKGLCRHIKVLGKRAGYILMKKASPDILQNAKGDIILNTGMIDKFGEYILLLYNPSGTDSFYKPSTIINSKSDFIASGFSKEQADLAIKPLSFFKKDERRSLPEKIDLDLPYPSLMHIIEERRERFPESVKGLPPILLASKIQAAVNLFLKMQGQGTTFLAKPIYSSITDRISWALPLHINTAYPEMPELAVIVSEHGDFYETKTILPYDDCLKDKIRSTSLYWDLW